MKKDRIYEIIETSTNHIIEDLHLSESYSEHGLNQIRDSLRQRLAFELLNSYLISTGKSGEILQTKIENEEQLIQAFDKISSELLSHPDIIKSTIIKFRNTLSDDFKKEIDKIK